MPAHRIRTKVADDGTLKLDHLPFQPGDMVEVVITPAATEKESDQYPLRGMPVRYDEPFEPVVDLDWLAAR